MIAVAATLRQYESSSLYGRASSDGTLMPRFVDERRGDPAPDYALAWNADEGDWVPGRRG